MWLGKIYELVAVRFIYAFFSRLERLGKLSWPLAFVRMKGIYRSLVLISLLFGFAGGRPVSPGRPPYLPVLEFKLLHEFTPLKIIYELENSFQSD